MLKYCTKGDSCNVGRIGTCGIEAAGADEGAGGVEDGVGVGLEATEASEEGYVTDPFMYADQSS